MRVVVGWPWMARVVDRWWGQLQFRDFSEYKCRPMNWMDLWKILSSATSFTSLQTCFSVRKFPTHIFPLLLLLVEKNVLQFCTRSHSLHPRDKPFQNSFSKRSRKLFLLSLLFSHEFRNQTIKYLRENKSILSFPPRSRWVLRLWGENMGDSLVANWWVISPRGSKLSHHTFKQIPCLLGLP